MKINIHKEYVINKSFEDLSSQLYEIISKPYNDSKYSFFGKLVSTEPLEFVFMVKTPSLGRPLMPELNSTKISATIYKLDSKSKLSVKTSTNPSIWLFFFCLISSSIFKLCCAFESDGLTTFIICLILSILTLVVDRVLKERIVSLFEDVLNINT